MEEIVCVLDKSGSMGAVREDARSGFNTFVKVVKEQLAVRDANLTLVWFDHEWQVGFEGRLSEFKPLKSYPIGGMTALLDGIGKTIAHVGRRFSHEHPEKVILAVLTDGHENSSKEFTTQTVSALIQEHREKYGWDVVFLAADQDAWDDSHNTRKGLDYSATVESRRRLLINKRVIDVKILMRLIEEATYGYTGPCPACGYWEPNGCGDLNCPRR